MLYSIVFFAGTLFGIVSAVAVISLLFAAQEMDNFWKVPRTESPMRRWWNRAKTWING